MYIYIWNMYAICMLCIAVYISPCVCKDFCLVKSRHFTRHLRVQRLDLRLLPQRKRYSLGCHGHSLTGDSYAHLCYHVHVYIYIIFIYIIIHIYIIIYIIIYNYIYIIIYIYINYWNIFFRRSPLQNKQQGTWDVVSACFRSLVPLETMQKTKEKQVSLGEG